MSGRRSATGEARRTFRRIYFVFELSEVQVHQAGDGGCFVFASRLQGRDCCEEVETRQGVLRLLGISELQRRLLGQTRTRDLSELQRAVPPGEDYEEAGNFPLLRE